MSPLLQPGLLLPSSMDYPFLGVFVPFRGCVAGVCGRVELMGSVQSRELGTRAPRFSRFILLGSFTDTLLMVSVLQF